jgi:hypothetical protein
MNYTLHQLQIFLKVVKTQSVTKASEELHLTQPLSLFNLKFSGSIWYSVNGGREDCM